MAPRASWLRTAALLAPVLLLASLGWCVLRGPEAPTARAAIAPAGRVRPQGDFWVGNLKSRPAHLNPFTSNEGAVQRVLLRFTHDALLDLDPEDGHLRPALATLVSRSPDGLEHVFALRDGAVFSDGKPVDLDDVAFTLETVRSPEVPAGGMHEALGAVAALERRGERRFALRLREPYFAGLERVAVEWRVFHRRWFCARVAELAAAAGEPEAPPGSARFFAWLARLTLPGPGTGPYQLALAAESPYASADGSLRLVRNPSSWRLVAYPECWNLAGVKLTFLADSAAALSALLQQRVDWWAETEPKQTLARHPELAAHYAPVLFDQASDGNLIAMWNCTNPALRTAAVRRGLTLCFDRARIAERWLDGNAREAVGWFRPGSAVYGSGAQPLPFAPAQARELFEAAPGPRLSRLVIGHGSGVEAHRRLLEAAVPAFASAGVELVVQPLELKVLLERFAAGELDGAVVVAYQALRADPFPWFHSSQRHGRGKNFMGYADADVDQALEAARREPDEGRRIELWRRFHEVFQRDQPVTVLAHPRSAFLVHQRFSGVAPGPLGLVPERWWVEPERRLYDDDGRFLGARAASLPSAR